LPEVTFVNQTNIDLKSLQKLSKFSSVPQARLEKLAANMGVKTIERKTKVFDQGDVVGVVYLLISGIVRISWINHARQRVLVTPISKGEFFGIGSLFSQTRHPYRAEALTDCTVGMIKPAELVDALMGVSFETYLHSTEILTGRIWKSFLRCIRGMRIPLHKRLALELLDLAASFGVQDSRGTILTLRTTHEDLADSVGVSRQMITQALAHFGRQGALIRDGRRLILDLAKLRKLLETGGHKEG
jgi:CRP/FNR family cyclic AMP-dependent transcriptional regulator